MNNPARQIILVAHNLRSCHNVGSLLRTAEGLGVEQVILSGYTPHPGTASDPRLPHEVLKIEKQIQKTALGAESQVAWQHVTDILPWIDEYRRDEWQICAIEQAKNSQLLPDFSPPRKLVLIVGREIAGIEPELLQVADHCLEIPMFGHKESFNVVQAAAMALYHCRFTNMV